MKAWIRFNGGWDAYSHPLERTKATWIDGNGVVLGLWPLVERLEAAGHEIAQSREALKMYERMAKGVHLAAKSSVV